MQRPVVGLAVIVKKNNRVLVGKRRNIIGHGQWGFPGGHLEHGESLKNAVRRELMEEAGIKIKNIQFQAVTNDIRKDLPSHYITLFFTADYVSGNVRNLEPHKCEGWEWVEWSFLISSQKDLFLPMQNLLKQNFNPFKMFRN